MGPVLVALVAPAEERVAADSLVQAHSKAQPAASVWLNRPIPPFRLRVYVLGEYPTRTHSPPATMNTIHPPQHLPSIPPSIPTQVYPPPGIWPWSLSVTPRRLVGDGHRRAQALAPSPHRRSELRGQDGD